MVQHSVVSLPVKKFVALYKAKAKAENKKYWNER